MTNFNFNNQDIASSLLIVKASGSLDIEALKDLELPEGKTIAQLLDEEKQN